MLRGLQDAVGCCGVCRMLRDDQYPREALGSQRCCEMSVSWGAVEGAGPQGSGGIPAVRWDAVVLWDARAPRDAAGPQGPREPVGGCRGEHHSPGHGSGSWVALGTSPGSDPQPPPRRASSAEGQRPTAPTGPNRAAPPGAGPWRGRRPLRVAQGSRSFRGTALPSPPACPGEFASEMRRMPPGARMAFNVLSRHSAGMG